MLRRKLIVINIVFAFVMLAIMAAGLVLLLFSLDRSDNGLVALQDLATVKSAMEEVGGDLKVGGNMDAKLRSAQSKFPEGFGLVLTDASGNVLGNTGLAQGVDVVIAYKAPKHPDKLCGTIVDGVVIVSQSFGNYTLHAVKGDGSVIRTLNQSFIIYLSVILVSLLVIFIGSIVVEVQVIFPRLKKLKEAMDEVYNGNYEQTLRLAPGKTKRRDEITALLVDFDMLRRKLRDATLAKEAADRERGVVVSGISHDLRTPLTVIKTHSKGLLDGVAQRVGREDEYINTIYSTALEMEGMVAKLADFAKTERHEVMYSFVVRDIGEHIQTFVAKHYIAYAARGLDLKCKVPKSKKLWVNIDKDQFNRVWQNLCDNSLKYKVKEEAHVLISAELVDDSVVIRVADDGPGIAEYEVEYIFESYYRGDASRTNPTDGSGLGLSIVKNCVLAHNGQIQAYNDNGLTIEITLPYRRKK